LDFNFYQVSYAVYLLFLTVVVVLVVRHLDGENILCLLYNLLVCFRCLTLGSKTSPYKRLIFLTNL
jgi:hypothetical protein